MGEMSDGDWGVIPAPPRRPDEVENVPNPKPEPPKTDEWPVRKVKEPPRRGE